MFRLKSRWYVYELVDPRNNNVFYVGKGQKNRIDAHEREAQSGVCSHKCNKIRSIVNSGNKIIKNRVAYFWDEHAAYDEEAKRILKYGIENLTNVVLGYGAMSKPLKHLSPAQVAMSIIKEWPGQFAFWLVHSNGGKLKATVEGLHPAYKAIWEVFYNKLAHTTFKSAMSDKKNQEEAAKIFGQYGITLVFDGS